MVAEQIQSRQVTATEKEKPVTKDMLKEIYKWSQSFGCSFSLCGCPCPREMVDHAWKVGI